MKDKVLIIYTPRPGTLYLHRRLSHLSREFQRNGVETVRVSVAQFIHEKLTDKKKLELQEYLSLVVAGGDGSVNAVVEKLLQHYPETFPPLAVVPWGTSNDVARQLNSSKVTAAKLLANLNRGNVFNLDVGEVNGRCFINVAAGGMFTDVAHRTSEAAKRVLGRGAYYLYGVSKIFSYRPFPLKVQLDEGSLAFEEEVFLFLVLNGSKVGGLFWLAPEASFQDGQLHLIVFTKRLPWFQGGKILLRALRGKSLNYPGTAYYTAPHLQLEFPCQQAAVIDGEKGPPPPWDIKILPSRVPFIKINS